MILKRGERPNCAAGFTLIELVVVVGLIAIMLAVSMPAVGRFIRNYRLRGAMDQVSSEINRARQNAIMKNANPGVSFVVIDNNTYRWILEVPVTLPAPAPQIVYGPLRDLPQGIQFAPGPDEGFRFGNLGTWCDPGVGAGPCAPALPAVLCRPGEVAQCGDVPGTYITSTAAGSVITVMDARNPGLDRTISVAPGGRVLLDAR